MKFSHLPKFIGLLLSVSAIPAEAVILYGADNSANLIAPVNGLPFDAVARVSSLLGIQDGGSGVHLGGGFMLTAAHISNSELNTVTFDGTTPYSRDLTYVPQQIGTADLKVFKLTAVPTVEAANLYTGTSEMSYGASLVGWGRGRVEGSALNTDTVPVAGGGTPLVKRWGTNDPSRTISNFNYSSYTFNALETVLGNVSGNPNNDGTGDFEAAATPRDSGSGLFQEIGGTWYLTGLTSAILQQSSGNVTYGNDVPWSGTTPAGFSAPAGTGDPNIFVRVTSYADDINALLPIPEPSSSLLFLCASLLGVMRRSRPLGV
jgi:hypothetical protein